MNKILNLVISQRPESDYTTGDPIRETQLPTVKQYTEEDYPNDFFLYVIKLGDKHCNANYGGAFDINAGILNSAPNKILKRARKSSAKILISWPMESFLRPDIFHLMHDYFEYHNIPLENVIYLTCCPNGKKLYEEFCRNVNMLPLMTMEYIPWYLYGSTEFTSQEYTAGNRSKLFLSMNRRMHLHRTMLFKHIVDSNLLEKTFISFPLMHPDSGETFSTRVTRDYPHVIDIETANRLEKLLPLKLDISDWKPYPLPIKSDSLDYFYNNSLFSIVCETYFFSKIIHLTEKTFKPIINRHPFIMVASAHTLKAIKDFGFKTFDSVIDESYDSIENDSDRFKKIIEILEEISQWSNEKQIEVSKQIKEIVDYNYTVLKFRPREELNKFINNYGI